MKRGQNMMSARRTNRQLVLRHIMLRPGIARQTLAELTGLTPASITNITGVLLKDHWIVEEGPGSGPRSVGRPSIGLKVASGTHLMAAVHLQRRLVTVGLAELDGTLVVTEQDALEERPDPRRSVGQVKQLLAEIVRRVRPPHVLGVGIGASGIVDYARATIRVSPHYGWANVPFGAWLAEAVGLPVVMDNNVRGMALAEHLMGSHRDAWWLAFLYVGQGIAAGIWADGRVYRGARGIAGEIGHTTVVPDGEPCWCENRGCLERYLSEEALRRQCGSEWSTPIDEMLAAAPARVQEQTAHLLAIALTNLENTYDPDVIVLGGWVDKVWPMVRDHVMDKFAARTAHWPYPPVRVVPSSFGDDIGLIGSAAIGLGQLVYGMGEEDWQPLASPRMIRKEQPETVD